MADVRLLIQEEGRAARNLIAFNVPVGTNNVEKITRKPPSVPRVVQSVSMKRSIKTTARVRSASTGRDKKSELQARYWAFLFGNLQRVVDGIYQTCEEDESISECKEVILVLENYTRDFHNLIEWFKVKWTYENSSPPLRRTPLAWEVRKTSPGRIWNSSIVPKCTSPLQRMSPTGPTCRSPIDQTIIEDTPILVDNKISLIKEESVFKTSKDDKNVSRNDVKNFKEKCKNLIERGIDQPSHKGKSVSSKVTTKAVLKRSTTAKTNDNNSMESKILTEAVACDVKNRNVRNNTKQGRGGTRSAEISKIVNAETVSERNERVMDNDKYLEINSINSTELTVTNSKDQFVINNEMNNANNSNDVPFNNETNLESKNNKINAKANELNGSLWVNSKIVAEVKSNSIVRNVTDLDIYSNTNGTVETKSSDEDVVNENEINNEEIEKVTTDFSSIKDEINVHIKDCSDDKVINKSTLNSSPSNGVTSKIQSKCKSTRPAYSAVSRMRPSTTQSTRNLPEIPKIIRSKTTLGTKTESNITKARPGTSVMVRRRLQPLATNKAMNQKSVKGDEDGDLTGSVEVLTKQTAKIKSGDESDGWQTVRSRYRRRSTHNLNMATRFHKPSTAMSLPALSIESPLEKCKKNCFTPDANQRQRKKCIGGKAGKNLNNEVKRVKGDSTAKGTVKNDTREIVTNINAATSTSMIAAVFKSEADLLEKRIQQFMTAQAERERIILEEESKREEADSQRSQQLSDEEASLHRQILELESTEIDVDTETDETDGETVLEIEGDEPIETLTDDTDDISLEDRYENMLEGMSWAERTDTLAQLQALVARHPGRALELHQKLSSPSRKRSLPETLRRYQAKQACAQRKRQKLLMEKSQRLRELLNKVEDVKSAKNQLIEDKRIRMEMKLKRAEENRTQHLLEVVRKAHDEDSKLKEIAFINELEAQNKRHDFMALCQEQEERLQGIQEERQRRQEEKAAKEAAAEERRRALEAERQLRIQKMRQARREREERVGKMQLEREKERQELAREKARDREERLSALHAAQLANQEELQKKIAQKQQESARRHGENIEHIRQRAVESSILRSEEVPPTLKSYPARKQCSLCDTLIPNEVYLLSHLRGKLHLEAVRKMHDGREPLRDELQRFNITQIRDVPTSLINNNDTDGSDNKVAKEKQKALKRRCRKMKQRMAARGQEWESAQKSETIQLPVESTNRAKFRRNLKELDRLCNNHAKTTWSNIAVAGLERCLGEITRAFNKSCALDQDAFNSLNGFDTLTNLLSLGLNVQNASYSLPNKSIVSVCRVYKVAINGHVNNIEAILLSNKVLVILDLLLQRLEAFAALDDHSQSQEMANNATGSGAVAIGAMQLLCSLVPEEPFEKAALQTRLQDVVGYLVAGGLIDRTSRHSRALIETDFLLDQDRETPLLLAAYELLSRICSHLKQISLQDNGENNNSDQTTSSRSHLLGSLTSTEAAGAVGTLYVALALTSQNQKGSSPTPNQAGPTVAVRNLAVRGLRLLRVIAELDLRKLQDLLGAEGTSLQWRLIASHLITRLSRDSLLDKPEIAGNSRNASGTYILSELFAVLGYFAVDNFENQLVLQSAGAGPSVLQQLCSLPFPFYGDPRLASFTLSTLLAATHRNAEATAALNCELSYQLLEEYRNSEEGKLNPLVRLLKDAPCQ